MEEQSIKVAFIVGSPRSGTTLLGSILDLHPRVSRWHEPYFVFDRYFRTAVHDSLSAQDATPEISRDLTKAVQYFGKKRGCNWVLLKSPRNSLKIPFLESVFPGAKYIHILRDGRDTTLSIHQKWDQRAYTFGTHNRPLRAIRLAWRFARRQPLLIHKIQAIHFEIGGLRSRIQGEPLLNKIRWGGRIGWGPRFPGWQSVMSEGSRLAFNAHQWVQCVESILAATDGFGPEKKLMVRYESLLMEPEETIQRILNLLDLKKPHGFEQQMPNLNRTNFGKWKNAFSQEEITQIAPILTPTLLKLGYVSELTWYS